MAHFKKVLPGTYIGMHQFQITYSNIIEHQKGCW